LRQSSTKARPQAVPALRPGIRQLLSEFSVLVSASGVSIVLRFMLAVVASRELGPERWGYWSLLLVEMGYLPLLQLGVLNGMNQRVPALRVDGSSNEARIVKQTALAVTVLAAVAAVPLLFGTATFWQENASVPVLGAAAAFFLMSQLQLWQQMCLRAEMAFADAARQQMLVSVLVFGAALAGLWLSGLPGFVAGQALGTALSLLMYAQDHRAPIGWSLRRPTLVELSGIGFPIMLSSIIFAATLSADRVVLAHFHGVAVVGQYAVALIATNGMFLVLQTVSQQFYPRIVAACRRADLLAAREIVRQQTAMNLALTSAAAVAVLILFPWIVRTFMPAYRDGLEALLPLVLSMLAIASGNGFANFLNSAGRQRAGLAIHLLSLPVAYGLTSAAAAAGWGPRGVAYAVLATFLLQAAALWRCAWHFGLKPAAGSEAPTCAS
jgi:O-antigen/teichoic acid export membrane protein